MSVGPAKRWWLLRRVVVLALAGPMTAHAQFDPPDLSDDQENPTVFNLTEPVTAISNTVANSTSDAEGADIDFFTVVVNPGFQIHRIELTFYDNQTDQDAVSFIGFGGGPILTSLPGEEQFLEDALGFALVGRALLESNLIDNLALGDVTIDRSDDLVFRRGPDSVFVPQMDPLIAPNLPLGAGSYAFVFQDTALGLVTYELAFYTSAVPEPNALILLVLCGLMLMAWRPHRAMVGVKSTRN